MAQSQPGNYSLRRGEPLVKVPAHPKPASIAQEERAAGILSNADSLNGISCAMNLRFGSWRTADVCPSIQMGALGPRRFQ